MRVLENINIDLKSHNIPNVDIASSFKLHYTILAPQLVLDKYVIYLISLYLLDFTLNCLPHH